MMQEKVNEYIRDNKVNMLGMPLPNEEKMKPIDFDTQEDLSLIHIWYINIAWFLYEFIALNIPMKHVHAPGKCNKGMVGKLSKHCLLYTSW